MRILLPFGRNYWFNSRIIFFMKKLLIALLIIFGAFIGVVTLMEALMLLAPEWMGSTSGLLFMQGLQTILLFGLTAVVGIWVAERKNPLRLMALDRTVSVSQGLIVFCFAVAALPSITWLAEWNKGLELPSFLSSLEAQMQAMEEAARVLTERFLQTSSVGMLFVNLFVMAFLPALCEEMMFRGWLQRRLSSSVNIHVAVWVSAFVFSAIHFQFYGFVPRMLIGAALGYMYYYTGSLWAPILAHFVNNAAAVLVAFVSYNGLVAFDFERLGTGDTWYVSVAALAVCVVLMSRLARGRDL